jgi:hypothetical protein
LSLHAPPDLGGVCRLLRFQKNFPMKKILTILTLFQIGVTFPILAQSKQDRTWVLGYPTLIPGQENTEGYGGMYLRFTEDTFAIENFDIYGGPISATANDQNGNVLFYTNGCSIFNRKNEIMENGDEVNIGATDWEIECNNYKGYAFIRSGMMTLANPSDTNIHILFHLRLVSTSDTSLVTQELLYSEINMNSINGFGNVTSKNNLILYDSLHDAIASTRHGNGRDWWIVLPRGTNREFWKVLYTPEGVVSKTLQTLPPPYSSYTVTYPVSLDYPPFVEYKQPDEYQFESWGGQATFSPDGTRYCRIIKAGDVEIYDFDRCSGELTLRRLLSVPPYRDYPEIPIQCTGVAISPNNRYLYFNNNEALFQFDLCEENINNGDFELIEYYDGYVDAAGISANFFQMRNGPDGKIYMTSGNTVPVLHVIDRPNEKGKACRFRQHGIALPRKTSWVINYFPNFNLYDLAGSPCDTLGIDDPNPPAPPVVFDEVKIYPNPAGEYVKVYIPQCDGANVRVWNVAGQLVAEWDDVAGEQPVALDVRQWPAGMYVFAVYVDAQKPVIQKVVVGR